LAARLNQFLFIAMKARIIIFLFSALSVFIISCRNSETDGDAGFGDLYLDCKVWSEEGSENATLKLQFRIGGPEGRTTRLPETAKVELDGIQLKADSAKLEGPYYEAVLPLKEFAGTHSIRYTSPGAKVYEDSFSFVPFTLDPEMPAVMTRGDLVFTFKGLDAEDYLRVWLSDTLFTSDDINDIDTIRNGKLVIHRERLATIAGGPINLQFHKEAQLPFRRITPAGGRIYITYTLKRMFELRG